MKPSNALHILIKSLTKSERRYFNLFSSRHVIGAQNNYLKLFQAIDQQTNYDQKAIEELPFVKNLSSEKNYLYKLILKSMRAFHSANSPMNEIWDLLQNFEFLQKKGLNHDAKKQLQKAKSIANSYERNDILLHILEEEAAIVKREKAKNLLNEVRSILSEKEQAINLLVSESHFASVYHRVFTTARRAKQLKSPHFQKELTELREGKLSKPPRELETVQAKLYYHQAMYMNFQASNAPVEAHPHFEAVVNILEAIPKKTPQQQLKYRVGLSNLLVSAFSIQNWEIFPKVLEKIRNTPKLNFEMEAEVFQNVAYLEMVFYMNRGEFAHAAALIPKVSEGLIQFASHLNTARKLAIQYNMGLLYFILEKMTLSRKIFASIEDGPKTDHRFDIQSSARLMQLLILLDAEEIELLDYRLRSFLRKDNRDTNRFEKEALGFMRDAVRSQTKAEFKLLCEDFCKVAESQNLATGLEYNCSQEFIYWIKSKLNSVPILQIALQEIEA